MRSTIRFAPKKEAASCSSATGVLCLALPGEMPVIAREDDIMRTRNLDEAIEAVSKVYCPHTVEVVGPVVEIDAFLEVAHPTSQPLVTLSYDAPVKINAQNFSRLFLMMPRQTPTCDTSVCSVSATSFFVRMRRPTLR